MSDNTTVEAPMGVRQRRAFDPALLGDPTPAESVAAAGPTRGPTQRNADRQEALLRESVAVAPPPEPTADEDDDLATVIRPAEAIRRAVRVAGVVVLLLGAVVALVAASQVANLLAQIATWPTPLRWVGDVGVGLLLLAVAVIAGRLAWRYFRLTATPGVSLPVDQELDHRQAIRREMARQQYALARAELVKFVDRYPLAAHTPANRSVGLTAAMYDQLRATRRTLMSDPLTDREWIELFDRQVMAVLDGLAAARVRRSMKQVAVMTAAIPQPTLDLVVVLGLTLRLIDELCIVYNVRASRWNSWMILLRLLFNVGAASQVDGVTHTAADHAAGALQTTLQGLGHATLASGAHLLGRVSGKAVSGGVNALLLWRLSRYVRASLRPVQFTPAAADALASETDYDGDVSLMPAAAVT